MTHQQHCPHADKTHCPLYAAAHEGMGLGCDDGQLASEQCAVSRGLDYAMEAAKVVEISPETFRRCQIKKRHDESKAQRKRNMRLNGVH